MFTDNLTMGDGADFVPYLRLNAKAGQWLVKHPETREDVMIQAPISLAFDFEHGQSGWICFPTGAAPEFLMAVNGQMPPRPGPIGQSGFKNGFRMLVVGVEQRAEIGQPLGVRELSSTANAVKNVIAMAAAAYTASKADHPGQLPVFQVTGVKMEKGPKGDVFSPDMHLSGWVDRDKLPDLEEAYSNGWADKGTAEAAPGKAPGERPVRPDPNAPPPPNPNDYGAELRDDEVPF